MKASAPDGRSVSKRGWACSTVRQGLFGLAAASAVILLFFPISVLAGEVYGTFTYLGEMNASRSYHTATLLQNGKVLIAGGRRTFRDELDSAELYDPSLQKFIPTGKMLSARAGHTATLLPNGKVLIAGGFQPGEALASAELYDPLSGTFSPTGGMAQPREWHTATLLSNGRVLVAGGASDETGITPTAEVYDQVTGKFVATSNMTAMRVLHYATALNDGDVLIVGGVRGGGPNFFFSGSNYLASAELYDPGPGRFSSVSGTSTGDGSNGSAVLLANGKVLIAGGVDGEAGGVDGEVIVSGARLYDPAERKLFPTGSMTSERLRHEATLLSDGRVLVTGGMKTIYWPGPTVVATAELYDPERGAFFRLPDMKTPRTGHTATLLPDGEVLIAGGMRGSFLGLSSAELYRPGSITKRPSVTTPSDGAGRQMR